MMEAVILGVLQGLTEFLPISSTAHLVVAQYLLKSSFPGFFIEIFLHLASALAICLYFRQELTTIIQDCFLFLRFRQSRYKGSFFFVLYIFVGTCITGLLGTILIEQIGNQLKSPPVVASSLVITAFFLFLIEHGLPYGNRETQDMSFLDAIIVGLAQTIAVFPGISRSGATLIASLWLKLNRQTAVRFSFLLGLPVLLGSSLLALEEFLSHDFSGLDLFPMTVSFLCSFLFSLLGITFLIRALEKTKLSYFGVYCLALAAFIVFYFDPSVVMEL